MTTDEIIQNLEEMVEKKIPVGPSYWLEQAQKLVVLMGDETDKLHLLQRKIANFKTELLSQGKSVAEAKTVSESLDMYEEMQNQKSKCERITEIIRIAKIQSRMRNEEFGAGGL